VGLVLWSKDTQKAIPFSLPPDALGPKLSPDHRQIVFRRDRATTQSEFWVIHSDGTHEKKMGTAIIDEDLKARYPDALFSLDYGWIPNTQMIYYLVEVTYGVVPPLIIDKFVLVGTNTGKAITLVNPAETQFFKFSPEGNQLAVQTASELRLVNTYDGQIQITRPGSLNSLIYSPNGNYMIDFIDKGILRIDTRSGQQQLIPLKYTIIVPPGGDSYFAPVPRFEWIGDATLRLTSLDSDQYLLPRFPDLDRSNWTFKIWDVNLSSGTTHSGPTFRGDPEYVTYSPDHNRIAYYDVGTGFESGGLTLADLTTGEILETISDGRFESWHPDSIRYIYSTGHAKSKGAPDEARYFLGQVGVQAIPLDGQVSDILAWLDAEWIVADCRVIHIS
jgi:hypothetical protein